MKQAGHPDLTSWSARCISRPLTPSPPAPPPPPVTQCGPRFEMKLYQIKLGTLDQVHVENEWQLRSYTRSAKKSKLA